MKKIVTIIVCLLCAITASALSYASPYKGAGRGGYIYTTSSARQHTISTGFAQAPVASMASTSGSSASRGIAYASTSSVSMPSVQGIRTSASNVSGGVTTMDTHAILSGPRKAHPGECPHCVDENEDGICDNCLCEIYACECEDCHCDVPLDFNWAAGIFMVTLAGAYTLYKVRAGKKETI